MGGDHRVLGKTGEDAAAQYLTKKGYRILHRNYRTRLGEIDIIAQDGETVVFVEVKSRRGNQFGSPEEAVGEKKIQRLQRCGELFLSGKEFDHLPARIDVISVLVSESGEPAHVDQIVNVTL